jgi:hypothetical protein
VRGGRLWHWERGDIIYPEGPDGAEISKKSLHIMMCGHNLKQRVYSPLLNPHFDLYDPNNSEQCILALWVATFKLFLLILCKGMHHIDSAIS